jgi:hypothetical protein
VAKERQSRAGLIRSERLGGYRDVVLERLRRQVGALVMEALERPRRHR